MTLVASGHASVSFSCFRVLQLHTDFPLNVQRMMNGRALANTFFALRRQLSTSTRRCDRTPFSAVRFASSLRPGAGNPNIIEDLPSTADEVKIEADKEAPSISTALPEPPQNYSGDGSKSDWSRSYFGLSTEPFSKEIADILQAPVDPLDIEIKPGMFPPSIVIEECDATSSQMVFFTSQKLSIGEFSIKPLVLEDGA